MVSTFLSHRLRLNHLYRPHAKLHQLVRHISEWCRQYDCVYQKGVVFFSLFSSTYWQRYKVTEFSLLKLLKQNQPQPKLLTFKRLKTLYLCCFETLRQTNLEIFHKISLQRNSLSRLAIPTQCCFCSGNDEQSIFGAIEYNHQSYGSRKNRYWSSCQRDVCSF